MPELNCPKCNSPLNGGECDLCLSLDNLVLSIGSPDKAIPTAHNWNQFFSTVREDELILNASSSDDAIQERIEALEELDRQNSLLKQSIRIRIQTDKMELTSRGVKSRSKKSLVDLTYSPVLPLAKIIPKTKLERLKADMNSLGIDLDKFMAELKASK
jgi:hypothetical protein